MNRKFLLLSLSREKTTKKNSLSRTESRTLNYHYVRIGDFQATIFLIIYILLEHRNSFRFVKSGDLTRKKQ